MGILVYAEKSLLRILKSYEAMEHFLKSDDIAAPEVQIFKMLLQWLLHITLQNSQNGRETLTIFLNIFMKKMENLC